MRKRIWGMMAAITGMALTVAGADLADMAKLSDMTAAKPGETVKTTFPAWPAKDGMATILRFKLVARAATLAGCNYNAVLAINGRPVEEFTADGSPRLSGDGMLQLLQSGKPPLSIRRFQKEKLLTMFAPDAATGDKGAADGCGASYELDISDLVKSDGPNELALTNIRAGNPEPPEVVMSDIVIGSRPAAKDADNALLKLPVEEVTRIPDFTIDKVQQEHTVNFPAMPAKPGYVPVLRCRVVSYAATAGGCNYNAQIRINDRCLTRYTESSDERLIGRNSTFGLLEEGGAIREFPVFAGDNLMTIFAPGAVAGDRATADKMGATFLFDLGDRVRGVDGNSVTFRNIRAPGAPRPDLIVSDVVIGYLSTAHFPKPVSLIPERGAIARRATAGNLELRQGEKGGFTVQGMPGGSCLRVETALGMTPEAPAVLRAEDGGPAVAGVTLQIREIPGGFELTAVRPDGLELKRTLKLERGLLFWHEVWRNASDRPLGVPFRHRFCLPDKAVSFSLGGDGDTGARLSSAQNPTLFLNDKADGNGFGIAAENDWLRLLMGLRASGGIGELYSTQLALEPGKSIEFDLTIDPETGKQGYWGFINRLRRRWLGDDTITAAAPYFWNTDYRQAPGATEAEKIRNSYAHLGPVVVANRDWSRLIYDTRTIHGGKCPLRPDGKPDIEKFVTFAHREPFYREFQDRLAQFAAAAPEAKLIMITHPAMEIVYAPEAAKWPYAADEIKTAQGGCFNDSYYSRAYLYDRVKDGWAIYYYVPSAGSAYLKLLEQDVRRYLETLHAPGIYFDEFSFGGSSRGYSRYNYGKSDGYSADLDAAGKVLRFKSDNAMAAKTAQEELVGIASRNGKLFYANGGPALTSVQKLPVLYFTEGGNGHGHLAGSHLTQVPLALGNYGDYKSRKGIFNAVQSALAIGTIYSPYGGNLLLEGSDNFVCKLYPITVLEIGPGLVKGKERLVTTRSGEFEWAVPDGPATLYRYDGNGDLLRPLPTAEIISGKIAISVPEGGLAVAERQKR